MSHSGKNALFFIPAEPLFFSPFAFHLDDTDLVVVATLVMLVWLKMMKVQPLKLLLSLVYSAAICALHITCGQTGVELCFSGKETAFPVHTSGQVRGRAMLKACSGRKLCSCSVLKNVRVSTTFALNLL